MLSFEQMLLQSEGVELHFTDAAINEIASVAEEVRGAYVSVSLQESIVMIGQPLLNHRFAVQLPCHSSTEAWRTLAHGGCIL